MPILSTFFQQYNYFDKPDGQDPLGKIFGLYKYILPHGIFASIFDAIILSRCQNAGQFLNTAGYYILPLTGMCLAFSGVTYVSTNIRKKDDKLNYAFGVLASGGILHAWQKQPVRSVGGTVILMYYALFRKHYKQNPNIVFPKPTIGGELERRSVAVIRNKPWNQPYGARFEHNKQDYYRNLFIKVFIPF